MHVHTYTQSHAHTRLSEHFLCSVQDAKPCLWRPLQTHKGFIPASDDFPMLFLALAAIGVVWGKSCLLCPGYMQSFSACTAHA